MKIRVLFPFSGHIVGGSHISALTLITHLPDDIEPVIGVFRQGPLTKYLDDHHISWIQIPDIEPSTVNQSLIAEIRQVFSSALPLRRFLKSQDIHIIHTQEYNMHCLWALAKIGMPVKHIWHQRSLNNSRRLVLYAPFIDSYLTISRFCRDHLVTPVRRRTEIVPNPVSIPTADLKEAVRLTAEPAFKIGFVGHLDQQKRILTFLEIARRLGLDPKCQNVRFFIFGDERTASAQDAHEFIKEHHLQSRCMVMGSKFPISPWIKELDLLMATAANEGLGRSIIEAQILGVPVLASENGGHKELIRNNETGFFANLDNVGSFVEKAKMIILNPDAARKVSEAARIEAVRTFSVETHVCRIVEIYRTLMAR